MFRSTQATLSHANKFGFFHMRNVIYDELHERKMFEDEMARFETTPQIATSTRMTKI